MPQCKQIAATEIWLASKCLFLKIRRGFGENNRKWRLLAVSTHLYATHIGPTRKCLLQRTAIEPVETCNIKNRIKMQPTRKKLKISLNCEKILIKFKIKLVFFYLISFFTMPWYLNESWRLRMTSQKGHKNSKRNSRRKSANIINAQMSKNFK